MARQEIFILTIFSKIFHKTLDYIPSANVYENEDLYIIRYHESLLGAHLVFS